ncbi:hypothetical protein DIPPA_07847 [Diplonema papillatum]|nr:hypothetical protein DIPPA_07850 [Diplonema papillatum]KAJ9450642.1 hypothetical protein DIPPA_07848 [Diplonema papillatum]KAJ9450643.1 hypothetical protein DIPPA_07856 [Diplonema papillatum]KAJ9450644.1 hypothetical protein DIPPA_07847 [Diplonema papillatum]
MGAVMPASVLQHAPPGTAVVHAADDRSADFYYHSSPQVPASKEALDYEYFRPISAPLMGARAAQPSGRAW